MLLHVIKHRILALLGNTAIRADKLTRGVTQIRHLGRGYSHILNSRHGVVAAHHSRARPGFKFCPAASPSVKPLIDALFSLFLMYLTIVPNMCRMKDHP